MDDQNNKIDNQKSINKIINLIRRHPRISGIAGGGSVILLIQALHNAGILPQISIDIIFKWIAEIPSLIKNEPAAAVFIVAIVCGIILAIVWRYLKSSEYHKLLDTSEKIFTHSDATEFTVKRGKKEESVTIKANDGIKTKNSNNIIAFHSQATENNSEEKQLK